MLVHVVVIERCRVGGHVFWTARRARPAPKVALAKRTQTHGQRYVARGSTRELPPLCVLDLENVARRPRSSNTLQEAPKTRRTNNIKNKDVADGPQAHDFIITWHLVPPLPRNNL